MAGGGLAVVLHAVEDPFDHVPPLVRLPVAIPWGRTIPLGRRGRRPGGIPLVRAVPGRVRAHERAGRGHRAAPVCVLSNFVGRFGVSFSPFERLFLGRFGFGQSCGLSVIA